MGRREAGVKGQEGGRWTVELTSTIITIQSVAGALTRLPAYGRSGQFRIPDEKMMPYETDIRVPFYAKGQFTPTPTPAQSHRPLPVHHNHSATRPRPHVYRNLAVSHVRRVSE